MQVFPEDEDEAVRSDLKISKDPAKDRYAWTSFIRNCPIRSNMENMLKRIEYDDDGYELLCDMAYSW